MVEQRRPYTPDIVSAPGDTIAELLDERGITQRELSERMGRSEKMISQIINGKAPITPETAAQLELVLGTPAHYWLTHEAHYREHLERLSLRQSLAEWHSWLEEFPVKELMQIDAIPTMRIQGKNKDEIVHRSLVYFGVASPAEWRTVYIEKARENTSWRIQTQRSDPGATASWLRLGEIEAQSASTLTRYDPERLREVLLLARGMTLEEPKSYLPELTRLCAGSGVVLALVPSIRGAFVSGAARWVGNRPLIQLSLFGRTNDRFWFTFFHEAHHILEHSKGHTFLDEWESSLERDEKSEEEREADDFARYFLIPKKYTPRLRTLQSELSVQWFANEVDVHPGIVVGRLQHDGTLPFTHLNKLKQRIPKGAEHVH